MSYLTIGKSVFKGVKNLFGKSTKAISKNIEVKAPKTISFTNASTGVTTTQREFQLKDGYTHLVKSDSQLLPDGTKLTRSHVWGKTANGDYHYGFGGDAIDRTKTITVEPDNILGGKTITINKNYKNTFGDKGRNETLVKVYDKNGVLQHKELNIEYTNGSGYKVKATQDREGKNLTSSAKDMLDEPNHLNCKHELSTSNGRGEGIQRYNTRSNYGNFSTKGGEYSRAISVKNAEKEAAAKALEEAKQAEKLKAQELASKRPRVNVGKVLNGINVDELKVVEKALPNGAVKRYYFLPETGVGKRKPVITTFDQGTLHKEWIHNGKEDIIYLKQVGKEEPYIYMQKGNYKQIHKTNSKGDIINEQYYTDGVNKYYRNGSQYNYYYEGEMPNPHYGNPIYEYNDRATMRFNSYKTNTIGNQNPPVPPKGPMYGYDCGYVPKKSLKTMEETINNAENSYVDLEQLLKPYEI